MPRGCLHALLPLVICGACQVPPRPTCRTQEDCLSTYHCRAGECWPGGPSTGALHPADGGDEDGGGAVDAGGVTLTTEAESGQLVLPMTTWLDPGAHGGRYAASSTQDQGSAKFTLQVPQDGDYVVWARVLARSPAQDSFDVTMDGAGEDTFDLAEGRWSNAWQWAAVNGRAGTGVPLTVNPRVFHLTAGTHDLAFETREPNAGLDVLIVTTDRTFIPSDPAPADGGAP